MHRSVEFTFHTGPRMLFAALSEAVGRVIPLETLRYVSFSHVEADECGSLNQFLAAAPRAVPLCGQIAAMVSIGDLADRPPRVLADQESLLLGRHTVKWIDTPHLPHGWDAVFSPRPRQVLAASAATSSRSSARSTRPYTESDILEPSEAARVGMDYYTALPGHRPLAGAPRQHRADDARLHARLGLARRRRGAAAKSRLAARGGDDRRTDRAGTSRPCRTSREPSVTTKRRL